MWKRFYLLSFGLGVVIAVGEGFVHHVEENIEQAKDTFHHKLRFSDIENGFAYGNKFGFDDEIIPINHFNQDKNTEELMTNNRKEDFDEDFFDHEIDTNYSQGGKEVDMIENQGENEESLPKQSPFQFSKLPVYHNEIPPTGTSFQKENKIAKTSTKGEEFNQNRMFGTFFTPNKFKRPRRPQFGSIDTERMTLDDWNNQSPFTIDGSRDKITSKGINKPLKQWGEQVIKIAIGKKIPGAQGNQGTEENDVLLKVWDFDKIADEKQQKERKEKDVPSLDLDEKIRANDKSPTKISQRRKIEKQKQSKQNNDTENKDKNRDDDSEMYELINDSYNDNEMPEIINDNDNEDNTPDTGTPMQEDWDELFNTSDDFWEKKLAPLPETTEKGITMSKNIRDYTVNKYPTISSTLTKNNEEPGKIKQFVAKICQISKSVGILKLCKSKRLVEKRKNKNNKKGTIKFYGNKNDRVKKFKDMIEEKKRKTMDNSETDHENNETDKKLYIKQKSSILGGLKSAISGLLSVAEKITQPAPNSRAGIYRKRKYQGKRRLHKKQRDERKLST